MYRVIGTGATESERPVRGETSPDQARAGGAACSPERDGGASRQGSAELQTLGLLILGSLILLLPACGRDRDPALIRASGHIEMTEVRLSAKVGGRLLAFPLREGDHVDRGQQIALIDSTDQVLQRDVLRADLEQATAELRLRLAGSRNDEIAETEALLARAQAELDAAERDLGRMEGLLREGSGTVKARDDARNRRDQAAANLEAVQQQLHRRRTGSRPEEIEAARARQSAAQARLAQVEQQLRDTRLQSPLAGLITEKLAEEGELLSPGSPVCVVTDLVRPWLTVYVGEPDLGGLRIGQEVEVLTDGGQKRTGRISFIAEKAEFTPKNVQTRDERVKLVYKIKISLENEDGLFKSGMPAEARIRGAAR